MGLHGGGVCLAAGENALTDRMARGFDKPVGVVEGCAAEIDGIRKQGVSRVKAHRSAAGDNALVMQARDVMRVKPENG
jgi:hypothetical protein